MNQDDVLVWISIAWFATLCVGRSGYLFFDACWWHRQPWHIACHWFRDGKNLLWGSIRSTL